MMLLNETLPYLVLALESALAHLGRGNVANQLREVTIERWTYDETSDVIYLHLRSPRAAGAAGSPGETVSLYDELGVNLDTDGQGSLTGIEVLAGHTIIAQLEKFPAD